MEMLVPLSPGFPTDFKELVRSRTDLVELIGESVTLQPRRGGREFVGLCPFHDDSNPSLTVSPERQSYKCWSCSEGGDCFSFVMKTQGLDFPGSMRLLAERAHIEIPKTYSGGNSAASDQQKKLYGILEWAENEFHHFLLEAREAQRARDYLAGRGFDQETITRFRVGYHPDNWNWLEGRAQGRYRPQEFAEVRLMGERRGGNGYYDNFVDRVLFPIRDMRGRPVAFGGRILPDTKQSMDAKYWNSPESQFFAKSNLLYAFDVARDGIRRSETAVVVEGYTDCITLHQHGIRNVVATLGTALTDAHVTLLKRFAHRVVLLYDGDEAGQKASERALSMFLAQKLDLRVLTLPGGMDPADFIADRGAKALSEQIEGATEAWEHKLQLSIKKNGMDSVDGRDRVLTEMLELMAVVPGLAGDSREDILLNRLSQRVGMGETKVRQLLGRLRRNNVQSSPHNLPDPHESYEEEPQPVINPSKLDRDQRLECDLLEIIFAAPETITAIRREVEPAEFKGLQLRKILEVCYDLSDRGVEPSYERVTAEVEQTDLKRLSLWIEEESRDKDVARKLRMDRSTEQGGERPRFLEQAIQNLKWRREEASHAKVKGQLAGMSPTGGNLDADAIELLRRQTEFHQQRATRKSAH